MNEADVEKMIEPALEALTRCFPGRAVAVLVWPSEKGRSMRWATNGRRCIVLKAMRALANNEPSEAETPVQI